MNILAIDLGGTFTKYGVIDSVKEDFIYTDKIPTETEDFDKFLQNIDNLILENIEKYNVEGIAFSSPGSVDNVSKVIHGASAIPFIHENNWVNDLEQKHNLKVSIENDANCAALAEVFYGNGKDCNNIISIVVGTGIGGAVIVDKKIVRGKHIYGGEFGYMYADISNPKFFVSQLLSTHNIVNKAGVKDGLELFRLFDDGNEEIVKLLDEYFTTFAAFLFNINHSLNPDKILIGGGVSERSDFVPNIVDKYNQLLETHPLDCSSLQVQNCKFNNDSNLIGAYANFISTKND